MAFCTATEMAMRKETGSRTASKWSVAWGGTTWGRAASKAAAAEDQVRPGRVAAASIRGSRVCRAASLRDSMAAEPCRSSTVAIKSSRLACREGRRLVGEAYHTVLTADASDRAFFTARSVVMALSGTAMSVHITLMDCAMCSAWLSGVFASLSISAEKSEVEARELGCVSMRFHRGSPVPGEPASSARFSEMRDRMPG